MSVPASMLNRHGRRTEIALARKAPSAERKYKALLVRDRLADARYLGLQMRLNKVRERSEKRWVDAEKLKHSLNTYD